MYPELLTHCCYSKQLNQIFTSFDHTLRTLGTAVETEVPAEPEVTLSKLLDWLIWETPHADIYLHINTLTSPLMQTLDTLFMRRNVSVGKPTTPLINHIYLTLPESAVNDAVRHYLTSHASTITLKPSASTPPWGAGGLETLTLTSDDPRRLLPVTNSVSGQLDQHIGTRIRKLTFRSEKRPSPALPLGRG